MTTSGLCAGWVVAQWHVGEKSNSWGWLQTHLLERGGLVVVADKEKWNVLEKKKGGKAQVVGVKTSLGPTPVEPGRYYPSSIRHVSEPLLESNGIM